MIEPRMTHAEAVELAPLYVLGALERAEETAVRDHLASCAEAHPEFEALGGVVPALLELDDFDLVEPPASLRERIMAAAAADLADRPSDVAVSEPVAPIPFPTATERDGGAARDGRGGGLTARPARPRASRFDWALRIAAVIAIVAIGAWGLDLRRQLDAATRFDTAVTAVVQAAGQAGAKPIVLTAQAGSKAAGIGAVRGDGSVVLAMRDLAATTGTQVYETWVIVGDDAPLAVGGFTVDANGTAAFTTRAAPTPAGAVIALTLEPNAGNTVPAGPIVSTGIALEQPSS